MDSLSRRLAALFVLGLLVFFSPVTSAFNRVESALGLPLFPLYLFLSWATLILAAWWLARGERP